MVRQREDQRPKPIDWLPINHTYGAPCMPATMLCPEERMGTVGTRQPQPAKAEPSESKLHRGLATRALEIPIMDVDVVLGVWERPCGHRQAGRSWGVCLLIL